MINVNDNIHLKNVISQKYYFNYKDFDKAMKMFLDNIGKLDVQITSLPFYSLNFIPEKDENVGMEFFIAVEEDFVDVPEKMEFKSYLSIEDMISINIVGDFKENSEQAQDELQKYMSENKLMQTTPLFNVLQGDDTFQYICLKVGAAKME